jgi:hypothetical protein
MLSLAKAAKDYYLRKLREVSPREDYYLKGGNATGHWRGSGAKDMGLSGTVTTEGLVRLFDGQDPRTGEQLGRQLRKGAVAAWDLTFSADKSVSLLWALGDENTRRHVQEAFEAATWSAFAYLEEATAVTRGASKVPMPDAHGGPVLGEKGKPRYRVETWPIRTQGFVAASFLEFTSRADDPQLHMHVVVGNRVKGVDGVWRALDGRLLYRHRLAAGYIHEAELRRELTTRLGVRWHPVRRGMADIAGFTRAQIREFSRRRQEIEAWVEGESLQPSPAALEAAALATRRPKKDSPVDELVADWRERAEAIGLTEEALRAVTGRSWEVREPNWEVRFRELTGPEGLTEKASTFCRADVIKAVAEALPEGGTGAMIERVADEFLHSPEVVPVLPAASEASEEEKASGLIPEERERLAFPLHRHARPRPMRRRDGSLFPGLTAERRYSTEELLATELAVVARAVEGVGEGRFMVPARVVERVLRRHSELTDEQRQMVGRFATSGDFLSVGVGAAGVGKTAVMESLHQLARLSRTPVLGAALAARAALVLQDSSGIPSSSLARLLAELGEVGLPKGCVVVVDEAAMVGSRDLAKLVRLVDEAKGKLVLTGDYRQLAEIDTGGLFRALAERLPAEQLRRNLRQRENWERRALAELRDGSVEEAVAAYRERGRVVVAPTPQETLEQAVFDWYSYVSSNGDFAGALLVAAHNVTVRRLNLGARALMAADRRLLGPTITAGHVEVQAGDRVLCLKNRPRLGVLNGDLATVVAVHRKEGAVTIRLDREGQMRRLPRWYLEAGHLDYGYALTGHKAQGTTVERAYVVAGTGLFREWGYVTMSRGREANTLYVVDPDPAGEWCTHITHGQPGPFDTLLVQLQRSGQQTAALDSGRPKTIDDAGLAARLEELDRLLGEAPYAVAPGLLGAVGRQLEEARGRLAALMPARGSWMAFRHRHDGLPPTSRDRPELQVAEFEAEFDDLREKIQDRNEWFERHQAELVERHELQVEQEARLANRLAEIRYRPPQWVTDVLGERPAHPDRWAAWDRVVDRALRYRQRHQIGEDKDGLLGPQPRRDQLTELIDWRRAGRQLAADLGLLADQGAEREYWSRG